MNKELQRNFSKNRGWSKYEHFTAMADINGLQVTVLCFISHVEVVEGLIKALE